MIQRTPFYLDRPAHADLDNCSDRWEDLELKSNQLRVAAEALTREVDVQMAALRQQQNGFSPINRLPLELLLKVFRHALLDDNLDLSDTFSLQKYYPRLHQLMQVSKGWRNTIIGSPQLWTVICIGCPDAVVTEAIAKSRPYSLQVSWTVEEDEEEKGLWPLVLQQSHRWKSAALGIASNVSDHIYLGGTTGLPALETLAVSCSRNIRTTISLSQDRAPKLRELKLNGVSLDWQASRLSGLRTLSLTDLPLHPSVQEIVDTLRNCPALEDLELDTKAKPETDLDEITSIALPRLESLIISFEEDQPWSYILNSLDIPICRMFVVRSRGTPSSALAEACARAMSNSLERILSTFGHLGIHMRSSYELVIKAGAPNPSGPRERDNPDSLTFYIDGDPRACHDLLHDWIPSVLQRHNQEVFTELRVSRTSLARDGMSERTLLSRFPGLEKLDFNNVHTSLDGMLEALSNPVPGEDGESPQWLCPRLHAIRFKNCNYSQSSLLFALIMRRRDAARATGSGAEPEDNKPIPFRNFQVSGSSPMDKGTLGCIKALVDDARSGGVGFAGFEDSIYD